MTTIHEPPEARHEEAPRAGRLHPRRGDVDTMSAGRALAIALVALTVGALLLADSVRSTANRQSDGFGRDVGMALTAPLAAVATALRLDRPRDGLLALLGREGTAASDAVVAFGSAGQERGNAAAEPPGRSGATASTDPDDAQPPVDDSTAGSAGEPPNKPAFSPSKPLRLHVAGDSLVITPGWALYRLANGNRAVEPSGSVDGRISTGLARPDYFDWFGHIRNEVDRLRPDALVFMIGGNDAQDYLTGVPGTGEIGGFGAEAWVREYRRRVGGLMDDVAARGAFLVWIGLPIARDETQSRRYALLNRLYRSEARKRPGAVAFVDTWSLFATEDGGYSDYLPNRYGQLVKVREGDGVHFERAGGDRIARRVMAVLREQFDLTSWKQRG
jgi:hypothetical protein